MRIASAITLIVASLSSVSGKEATVLRGKQHNSENSARKLQELNIVELAASTEELSTLAALLDQGGFLDELTGPGPFTVFAPSNAAFQKLPDETIAVVTSTPSLLEDILDYHIINGTAVLSSSLTEGLTAVTEEGSTVVVTSLDPVTINDAVVTTADIIASNGVIHIIDTVLIPPDDVDPEDPPASTEGPPSTEDSTVTTGPPSTGDSTIAELAAATPELSTLAFLLTQAGYVEALSGPGPFTVFAPDNAAFANLPGANQIIQTPVLLSNVLLYHVVPGAEILSTQLAVGVEATTLQGKDVTVTSLDPVMINRATVKAADIAASNGVIHIIDQVMIPPL